MKKVLGDLKDKSDSVLMNFKFGHNDMDSINTIKVYEINGENLENLL